MSGKLFLILNIKDKWSGIKDVEPVLRRFIINTLFDSTFTLVGIIVSSAFIQNPEIRVTLGTMISSSVALGISTGTSVYEAESLEGEKDIKEKERALLEDLEGTQITKNTKRKAFYISLFSMLTPLFICSLTIPPFVLALIGLINVHMASWFAIGISFAILFFAGIYFDGHRKKSALIKGVRMVLLGTLAFLLGYWIKSLF